LRILDESERCGGELERQNMCRDRSRLHRLEFAATARAKGLEVDVIELGPRVMARAVTAEISDYFHDRHAAAGIRIHSGRRRPASRTQASGFSGVSLSMATTSRPIWSWSVLAYCRMSRSRRKPTCLASGIIVDKHF